ncbi:MAG: hypothetical protein ACOCRX_03660 [Candidatus Woesearchaeota archaeon]
MIFNYKELPAEIKRKVIEYLTKVEEGEDLDIKCYIKENEKYSYVFEELRMKLFVNDLFERDKEKVGLDLLNESDHKEIWDMVKSKSELEDIDKETGMPEMVVINSKEYNLKSYEESEDVYEIEGYNLFEQSEEIKNIKLIFSDKTSRTLNIEEIEKDDSNKELSLAASSKDLREDKEPEETEKNVEEGDISFIKKNFHEYKGPYQIKDLIIEFYYRQVSIDFIPVYIRFSNEGMY